MLRRSVSTKTLDSTVVVDERRWTGRRTAPGDCRSRHASPDRRIVGEHSPHHGVDSGAVHRGPRSSLTPGPPSSPAVSQAGSPPSPAIWTSSSCWPVPPGPTARPPVSEEPLSNSSFTPPTPWSTGTSGNAPRRCTLAHMLATGLALASDSTEATQRAVRQWVADGPARWTPEQ